MSDTGEWRRRHWFQNPRCAWCGRLTVLWVQPKGVPKGDPRRIPPLNNATVDHLRDRYDPTRREPIKRHPEVRRVLACLECNLSRSERRTASLPLEELHRRSGRPGKTSAGFHQPGCPRSAPEANGSLCICGTLARLAAKEGASP